MPALCPLGNPGEPSGQGYRGSKPTTFAVSEHDISAKRSDDAPSNAQGVTPFDVHIGTTPAKWSERLLLEMIWRRVPSPPSCIGAGTWLEPTSHSAIFLADAMGRYIGRICHYRECCPRVACRALSCGLRQHLNDDPQIVTPSPALVKAPPIDLWPRIVARCAVPTDTHALLVAKLDDEPHKT